MKEADIEKGVKEILAKRLNINVDKISRESKLTDDLGMDSFGAVEVVFEMEDKFGIRVKDEDIKNIKTVKDIIQYVIKK